MKTITLITLFVGALAFITSAYASVSGNLGVTTDYIWRGASQSDGISVSGGLDYAGEGFYAGVWMGTTGSQTVAAAGTDGSASDIAGSVDSVPTTSTTGGADSTGLETNLYIGTDINGFDVGVIQYSYSDGAGSDATEAYIGYSVAGFDLAYAQDLDDSDLDFFSVSYGLPTLIEGVSSALTYGDTGDDDYLQLDVSYNDLTITFVDNDGPETLVAVSYGWAL
jgi:hypothetical protein